MTSRPIKTAKAEAPIKKPTPKAEKKTDGSLHGYDELVAAMMELGRAKLQDEDARNMRYNGFVFDDGDADFSSQGYFLSFEQQDYGDDDKDDDDGE